MDMFGGMCKNVWVLQLSFFINEKVASKNVPDFPVLCYSWSIYEVYGLLGYEIFFFKICETLNVRSMKPLMKPLM